MCSMVSEELLKLTISLLLVPFAGPTARETRSKRSTPVLIPRRESAKTFVCYVSTVADSHKLHEARQAAGDVQPYVVALGEPCKNVDRCLVRFLDCIYEASSIITAVDLCFKIFFVLNLEYPKPCEQAWIVIQKLFYGISVPDQRYNASSKDLINSLTQYALSRQQREPEGGAPVGEELEGVFPLQPLPSTSGAQSQFLTLQQQEVARGGSGSQEVQFGELLLGDLVTAEEGGGLVEFVQEPGEVELHQLLQTGGGQQTEITDSGDSQVLPRRSPRKTPSKYKDIRPPTPAKSKLPKTPNKSTVPPTTPKLPPLGFESLSSTPSSSPPPLRPPAPPQSSPLETPPGLPPSPPLGTLPQAPQAILAPTESPPPALSAARSSSLLMELGSLVNEQKRLAREANKRKRELNYQ